MAGLSRRDFLKVPAGAGLVGAMLARPALALDAPNEWKFQLDNGFNVQVVEEDFGYTALLLSLRSQEIMRHDGLSHIMEHTSFVGAAGDLQASDVEQAWKDHVQDSNASTTVGEITWTASFLPHHLNEVMELLALTSLDQRFDVPTVEQEKAIVLQELYEDKFGGESQGRRQFEENLYGKNHPLVRDTTDAEIRKARTPAEKLARELRSFSDVLRLPANMNLFILGSINEDRGELMRTINKHFGRYARKQGPVLEMPQVPRTSNYKRLTKRSRDLNGPLSELEIAWNTGVTLKHADAATLMLLAEYTNSVLFDRIREESGASYSPEASFDVCNCFGVFDIYLTTTRDPRRLEKHVVDVLCGVKKGIEANELKRFKERFELTRRRNQRNDETLLDNMSARMQYGIAAADLNTQTVSADQVRAAALRYLPTYRGPYVRLARLAETDRSSS